MDVPPEYEGQAQCDPTPKPGTQKLADYIRAVYGSQETVWIPRGCDVGGQSEHKDGRAIDWMVDIRDAQERADAESFLNWLLGPDQFGVEYGNAMRLGVMYIAWNDRIWRGYDIKRGWTEMKGCFSTTGKSADNHCHRNHIHISLTWDGASGRTSFWDGTPLSAPFCPREKSTAVQLRRPAQLEWWELANSEFSGREVGKVFRLGADCSRIGGRAIVVDYFPKSPAKVASQKPVLRPFW